MSLHDRSFIWSIIILLSLGTLSSDSPITSNAPSPKLEQYLGFFKEHSEPRILIDSIDIESRDWRMPISRPESALFNMPYDNPNEKP